MNQRYSFVINNRFVTTKRKKKKFIEILSKYLDHNGFFAIQTSGDADTDIVSATLKVTCNEHRSVAVVADDSDIFCMLVYNVKTNMPEICFISEATKILQLSRSMSASEIFMSQ